MHRLLLASAFALAGCASAPPIIGHCELPEALASKDSVADLDASAPIPLRSALEMWALDRHHLAVEIKKHNDTVDWVQGHCQ
jgi:hypothetical protein